MPAVIHGSRKGSHIAADDDLLPVPAGAEGSGRTVVAQTDERPSGKDHRRLEGLYSPRSRLFMPIEVCFFLTAPVGELNCPRDALAQNITGSSARPPQGRSGG